MNFPKVGVVACRLVFILGVFYALATVCGFASLSSPESPIGNPWFTLMEILILMIAPAIVVSMISIHFYAIDRIKKYTRISVLLMIVGMIVTMCAHTIVLTKGDSGSFTWPSMIYLLDIIAWDLFFGLSFLLAAPAFNNKIIRWMMIIAGALSLAGLLGIPFNNMSVRNIGIIGYAAIAPVVFLLISMVFKKSIKWRHQ